MLSCRLLLEESIAPTCGHALSVRADQLINSFMSLPCSRRSHCHLEPEQDWVLCLHAMALPQHRPDSSARACQRTEMPHPLERPPHLLRLAQCSSNRTAQHSEERWSRRAPMHMLRGQAAVIHRRKRSCDQGQPERLIGDHKAPGAAPHIKDSILLRRDRGGVAADRVQVPLGTIEGMALPLECWAGRMGWWQLLLLLLGLNV